MEYVILITLGTIWGASYLFIKIGGESIPPITFVMGRVTIAGIALAVFMLARRERLPALRSPIWKWLLAMGVLNSVIPYSLITWGETRVSSGLAAILVGAMPIFTVLFAHGMIKEERLTPLKVGGIIAGFLGVIVLFLPDLGQGASFNLLGGVAIILAAISYALSSILARKNLMGVPHVSVALGQMITASIILVPASLMIDHPWTLTPTPASIASLLALALVGTAFAYLLYYWLIEHAGATRTSLVTYISPAVAVFLGAVFLGESLEWTTIAGLVLIVAGVGLVTRKSAQTAQLITAAGPE